MLSVLRLPVSETVGILHLLRTLVRSLGKETDSRLAGFSEFALVRIENGVNMCAAVTRAVSDFFLPCELAAEVLNGR